MAAISLGKNVAVGVPLTISGTFPGEHPYGVFRPRLCIAIPDGTILTHFKMTCVWPHDLSKS